MAKPKGLGKKSRERLSRLIREIPGVISVSEASRILKVTRAEASRMLSYWQRQGWVYRIRRGAYIPVPIDSLSDSPVIEDVWIAAEQLFAPCYIGGWTAAEYWDFTEQIFRSLFVFTTKRQRKKKITMSSQEFCVRLIPSKALFGMKKIWRGNVKMHLSDPTRTLLDFLNDPTDFGGGRVMLDLFRAYLSSKYKDLDLLIDYAERLGNRTVFKRLGYLMQSFSPEEESFLERCKRKMSKGYSYLDPALKGKVLETKWRLWIPDTWKDMTKDD